MNFVSNQVTIDFIVLIKNQLIGGVDVLHEQFIVLLFYYFTSIDLTCFKLYVFFILLVFVVSLSIFAHIKLLEKKLE